MFQTATIAGAGGEEVGVTLGVSEDDGDVEGDTVADGLTDWELPGDTEGDELAVGEDVALGEDEGDEDGMEEAVVLMLGVEDGVALMLGDWDRPAVWDTLGDAEGDGDAVGETDCRRMTEDEGNSGVRGRPEALTASTAARAVVLTNQASCAPFRQQQPRHELRWDSAVEQQTSTHRSKRRGARLHKEENENHGEGES